MTVNITINADTFELTNVDGMTRIVCNGELASTEKSTRDTLAEHKAKTKAAEDAVCAQIDKMTRSFEERNAKSDSDWIVRRKLKPQKWHGTKVKEGFYFMRLSVSQHWVLWHITEDTTLVSNHPDSSAQILGPITPDMFL